MKVTIETTQNIFNYKRKDKKQVLYKKNIINLAFDYPLFK